MVGAGDAALRDRLQKPKGKLWNLIDDFRAQSDTPPALEQMMHDIREFGNIAGHPGQDQEGAWANVDPVEASYALDVISEVLEFYWRDSFSTFYGSKSWSPPTWSALLEELR